MNKHIHKRYFNEGKIVSFSEKPIILEEYNQNIINDIKKKGANKFGCILYDKNNTAIAIGSLINNSGTDLIIPIPELPLVYFDFAYNTNKARLKLLKSIRKEFTPTSIFDIGKSHSIYDYYGLASATIINLVITLEAFLNTLPNIEAKQKTKDKIKLVKGCSNISFINFNYNCYSDLFTLIKFRDELIHLKYDAEGENASNIIKELINYKYQKAFEAVEVFMNFAKNDYVVACACGSEY